eukprot:366255-Chlamydomonas_euryale.AAC.3
MRAGAGGAGIAAGGCARLHLQLRHGRRRQPSPLAARPQQHADAAPRRPPRRHQRKLMPAARAAPGVTELERTAGLGLRHAGAESEFQGFTANTCRGLLLTDWSSLARGGRKLCRWRAAAHCARYARERDHDTGTAARAKVWIAGGGGCEGDACNIHQP